MLTFLGLLEEKEGQVEHLEGGRLTSTTGDRAALYQQLNFVGRRNKSETAVHVAIHIHRSLKQI